MVAIIFLIIGGLVVLGGLAWVFKASEGKFIGWIISAIGAVIVAGIAIFGGSYTQDPGEAIVLKSFTGKVVGQSTSEGLHWKAPWVSKSSYDIRNQQVILAHSKGDEAQGANGPQVTVQDKEGVSANVDITVRYSIDPAKVTDIYKRYGSQENFISRFVENDIRAAVREVPGQYTTLEFLTTGRAKAEAGVREYIEKRWDGSGVRVESVSLQEIRYSAEVKQRFDAAQSARIEVEKAEAELDATRVNAQQKIVQAKAESEANRELTKSLTPEVLSQRYLDTLRDVGAKGNLVITPDGFNGMINLPAK
jgi:regulator of protease activity HflC (stomatin/prohibitin superfamily)